MFAESSSPNHPTPPKPKPFHMTEPFQEREVWCFWLAAEEPVLQFVQNLHCIMAVSASTPFGRRPPGRVLVTMNPRYDAQEVWLWIYDLLEAETQQIELDDSWEAAIVMACESEDSRF
jgi:hypothetical protein